MSNQNGKMKQLAKLVMILMLGASMSACAGLIGHTASWEEEVQLHDGRKIIVKVKDNLGGYPAIESREHSTIDETITFKLPDENREIEWKMGYRDDLLEPNSLNLIRFDVVNGVPYIATYPAGCIAYNKWGRPNPPQVLFKYEGEQWKRIALADLPLELFNTNANVIVGRPASSLLKSFYTVEGVDAANHDIYAPEFRTILREAVPVNQLCPEWVYFEGSWVTPSVIESEKRYRQLIQ
ncbi:MAG TPA: hypothetical protein DCK83_00760 [Gallionellaceae bacterium]|nr:hypothetical protein [Gallionellaceae bacterium]